MSECVLCYTKSSVMCAWIMLLAVLPAFAGWRGHSDVWCSAASLPEPHWSPGSPPPAQPAFAPATTSLLATRGGNVTLYCTVLGLHDKTVSWIRSRDLQILAHGGSVFTGDSRVTSGDSRLTPSEYHLTPSEALLTPAGLAREGEVTHWLTLQHLRNGDAGRYECQLNTEPKMSLFFNLTVLESARSLTVHISGPRVQRVTSQAARIQCEASLQAPGELPTLPEPQWYYEGQPLELPEGVSVSTTRWAGGARCTLLLRGAARRSGSYTCRVQHVADAVELLFDDDNELQDPQSEWMQRDQSLSARVYGAGSAGVPVPAMWNLAIMLAALVSRW